MVADDIFLCATELGEEDGVFMVATNLGEGEGGLVREPDDLVILAAWVAFSCHREKKSSSCKWAVLLSACTMSELTDARDVKSVRHHVNLYQKTLTRYLYT